MARTHTGHAEKFDEALPTISNSNGQNHCVAARIVQPSTAALLSIENNGNCAALADCCLFCYAKTIALALCRDLGGGG